MAISRPAPSRRVRPARFRAPARLPMPVSVSVLVAALALLVAGCGGDDGDDAETNAAVDHVAAGATLVVANSPGTLSTNGPQRVLVALVGQGRNEFFGQAGEPAVFQFTSPDGGTVERVGADFLSTEGVPLGLYVMRIEFPVDGRWEIRVAGTDDQAGRSGVDVAAESLVPDAGDPAPRSVTPVADDQAGIGLISTDLQPDPDFYRLSIDEAVTNGRPTVIAFATPAFCQTALCGPTLDRVKEAVVGIDDLDVVHVEPFDIPAAQSGSLEPVPAMFEWQLVTEPWVYVIDADGLVHSSFEGTIGDDELRTAIDAVTS